MYKGKQLHHFYHIFCSGSWMQPLSEHINALRVYKLLDNLDTINFGLVGLEHERDIVKKYLSQELDNFNIVAEEDSGWEQETIYPLHEFAINNDGYIYYAHTKSAAYHSVHSAKWRRSMTYFTAVEWERCIYFLNDGFDAVGSHYCQIVKMKDPQGNNMQMPVSVKIDENIKCFDGYFSGNFWWVTAESLRSLNRCPDEYRHDAEFWISDINLGNKKIYDLHPKETMLTEEQHFVVKW